MSTLLDFVEAYKANPNIYYENRPDKRHVVKNRFGETYLAHIQVTNENPKFMMDDPRTVILLFDNFDEVKKFFERAMESTTAVSCSYCIKQSGFGFYVLMHINCEDMRETIFADDGILRDFQSNL